uniref:Reverse transcriptase domain-containing protein n=1 Tax=Tanacetum cinerariifolium TaxID=118510 RepID=A0A6L2NZ65_TANCI|nr:reverse transcriptase domain-containing protein [Tanacetum cinerariifolium]
MLGENNIAYRPRMSVKGQILADFLTEMPGDNPQAAPTVEIQQEPWTLFTDDSSSSNNEAEYEALIAGLRIAAQMGVKDVHVSVNSKLVANQVLGTYVSKKDSMVKYLEIVKSLVSGFTIFPLSAGRNTQRHIYNREGGDNSDRGGWTDLDDTDRPGKVKFLIASMDYFTKWIETKAVATITVIPTEIGMPTYRTTAMDVVSNDEELLLNLDLLKECNDASHVVTGGKLGPKWEGPYEVTEALRNGVYKLRSRDGTILLRTWNIANLKRCYL